ncbi:hypothetical protein BC936DRAFT_139962 [Jimgerdemannia flammicorona]|uniref:Protein kinase domain-containing protein n=1 Tax=Jimgerdemannia flammicorona TaxID=994334 RepID=A0A433DHF4_9FUNG|nr:hypothetical protein BC936DRAFT_139962 [Jimgerdemannia flammicorona]
MSTNSPLPESRMSESRLQQALSRVKRFDELSESAQNWIRYLKREFRYEDELAGHLAELGLSMLQEYLVWIPLVRFVGGLKQIGRGGFATVWKGRLRYMNEDNTRLVEEDFALKEFDKSMLQEIVLNILIVTGVGTFTRSGWFKLIGISKHEESGKYLVITRYAGGGNLEQRLNNNAAKAMPWSVVYKMACSISEKLIFLHELGLAHGDFHPGNLVFVREESMQLGIIDIGLGIVIANAQSTTHAAEDGCYGRLSYLPPECFARAPYTQKSDIYCLGTILWQLVSHVPPRGTAGDLFRRDGLREDPVPGTPAAYQEIINACWNLDPARRPEAREVDVRLGNLLKAIDPDWHFYPLSAGNVRAHFNKHLRDSPSDKTASYVKKRVAEYQRDVEAERSGSGFSFADGATSVPPSLSHRSQFYTRRQLLEYSQSHVVPLPEARRQRSA